MPEALPCAAVPCGTCPYARRTPLGIWDASEYEKLPAYDEGGMALGIFLCHQTNATGKPTVCRGWLSVAADSIAVRLAIIQGQITPEQRDAPPLVELYGSGVEAAEAGLAGVERPGVKARQAITRLVRKGAGKV